jgi:YfiH family protein
MVTPSDGSSRIWTREFERTCRRIDFKVPRILTGVKTADCVPVLIGDPVTKAFAAVHAGWRGTLQSIGAKTVKVLNEVYGSEPGDLICAIGPAACGRNYEVGQDVIDGFANKFSNSEKYFHLLARVTPLSICTLQTAIS